MAAQTRQPRPPLARPRLAPPRKHSTAEVCDVPECTDRARYRYLVACTCGDYCCPLPPVCTWMTALLCGTHRRRPWPLPAYPVRKYLGRIS